MPARARCRPCCRTAPPGRPARVSIPTHMGELHCVEGGRMGARECAAGQRLQVVLRASASPHTWVSCTVCREGAWERGNVQLDSASRSSCGRQHPHTNGRG